MYANRIGVIRWNISIWLDICDLFWLRRLSWLIWKYWTPTATTTRQ